MSIKSVTSDSCCKEKELPYPKLMVAPKSGAIVLMEDQWSGTVVHGISSQGTTVAGYADNWTCRMRDYKGDVCLTNGEN